jgi:hypothetical protein
MKNFLSKHWKKLLGGAVAVAGAFVPGLQPLIPVGALILGSDFQLGSSIGTPLGAGAKRVVEKHESLSGHDLQVITEALAAAKAAEHND